MRHVHRLSSLIIVLLLCAGALPAATQSFSADDALIVSNPERGMMGYLYPAWTEPPTPTRALTQADCDRVKAKKYSVIGVRYCLWPWRTGDLPADFLTQVASNCALARANGLKLGIAFAYIYASNNGTNAFYDNISDAPLDRVLKHIDQLTTNGSANNGPLLANNDVVAFWNIGFIGSWGEEHHSSNDLLGSTPSYWELNDASLQIWNALLSKVPSDRMIATRYCAFKKQFFNGATLSAPAQTAMGRIGIHDDSFSANIDNYGSFQYYSHLGSRVDELRAYASNELRYTVSTGETYGDGPDTKQQDGNTVISEMKTFSLDHYNAEHDDVPAYAVTLDKWRAQGLLDTMQNRLGYRLNLISATLPDALSPGSQGTLNFSIENHGFGKLYNPRPVKLLLCRKSGGTYAERYLVDSPLNPRRWLAATRLDESITFTVPSAAPAGTYDVLLALPDAYASLAGNPAYSVRIVSLNNGADIWNQSLGANWIGSLTVGAANPSDLSTVKAQFGRSGAEITTTGADLNGDGRVDAVDLSLAVRALGR